MFFWSQVEKVVCFSCVLPKDESIPQTEEFYFEFTAAIDAGRYFDYPLVIAERTDQLVVMDKDF